MKPRQILATLLGRGNAWNLDAEPSFSEEGMTVDVGADGRARKATGPARMLVATAFRQSLERSAAAIRIYDGGSDDALRVFAFRHAPQEQLAFDIEAYLPAPGCLAPEVFRLLRRAFGVSAPGQEGQLALRCLGEEHLVKGRLERAEFLVWLKPEYEGLPIPTATEIHDAEATP